MRMMATIAFVATTVLLVGCSGKVYTVLNPDLTVENGKEKKVEGVIVYPIKNVVEVYDTRVLVDSNKIIIGRAPADCQPKRSLKFSTRADYSSPYKVLYEPGVFESNSFAVTLKDGTLASINASSDLTKGLTALAATLPFVATPHAPAYVGDGKPFCNEQPVLVGVFEAPEIRGYDRIPPMQ